MEAVNVNDKFSLIHDRWKPRVIAELNGQQVKISKVQGEFVWHHHQEEDELFMIVKGTLQMEFRDKTVKVKEGEIIVVPRGVEHRPVAKEEVWMILFEPKNIKHTGNVRSKLTVDRYESI